MSDLKSIKTIFWDLDGTLYKFDRMFIDACNQSIAKVGVELDVGLTYDQGYKLACESFEDHNFSGQYLLERFPIDGKKFHFLFHRHINETIIKSCVKTQELLGQIRTPMGIISHGSKEWVLRMLDHLNIRQYFHDDHILAFEDYDYAHKARHTLAYETLLHAMNAAPQTTLMVEDSYKNLEGAKRAGLMTSYLHHGKQITPTPDYIDSQYNNVIDLIKKGGLISSPSSDNLIK